MARVRKSYWNNPFFIRTPPSIERCPQCRLHFREQKVSRIWKDFVECLSCGHSWILRSEKAFDSFYDPKKGKKINVVKKPVEQENKKSPTLFTESDLETLSETQSGQGFVSES